ncbi:MAG: translation initiation factor IF-2 [Desulfovibrio sp.]|jgi:hypothetical protein|nr:translation initiation factor IF-2 [Desulfovibrio sp.]
MFGVSLSHITAAALTPEQLVHYVRAVSGRRALLCAGHVLYVHEKHGVLVAYPDIDRAIRSAAPLPLTDALNEAANICRRVTVLAPFRPTEAPAHAHSRQDAHWILSLPHGPGQKLRNMLARAGREVTVREEIWSEEHFMLVKHYLQTRALSPGTHKIFSALPRYAAGACPENAPQGGNVLLLAARNNKGALAGITLGDFSGLHTAFYMFAFHSSASPPGTADILLRGLTRRAADMGHARMNLGLGINSGIAFFKRKWGAKPLLPHVETSWDL